MGKGDITGVWYDEAGDITQAQMDYALNGVLPPPRQLDIDPNKPDFHPCYVRVGVRIDGEERNDIAYYNLDNKSYRTNKDTSHLATEIEPYWRWLPNRQQRRAEERWEAKHG